MSLLRITSDQVVGEVEARGLDHEHVFGGKEIMRGPLFLGSFNLCGAWAGIDL